MLIREHSVISIFIAILTSLTVNPTTSHSAELWNKITGATKVMKANVTVFDSDTIRPLWGSHVILGYHKRMKDAERRRIDENHECKGQIEGVTDKEGKINLVLKVEHCPTRGIESEGLYLTVTERNYVKYQRKIEAEQIDVALERYGYNDNYPPLKIEYPRYVVDIDKYKKNFALLNEMNKRNIGDKLPVKSYFAWEYSQQESLGQEGFNDFLEKIEFVSNINGISLLQEILDKKYSLPYKRIKFKEEESWRSSDYVYDIGREAVAKSLLNISDDRADKLLSLSTDIPDAYFKLLKECGVTISTNDYWDYLSGKYVSRAHNPLIGQNPRPDPLIFVRNKLKENVSSARYADCLFKAYQLTYVNSADKTAKEHYKWQVDKDRLAADLFDLYSRLFTAEVKRLLPTMEANGMTRKYITYLYRQGEYEYLASTLKSTKSLMKAFLAEDVKETTSWNTTTNETKDLGVEECLITRMPKVTERIKKEIEAYLKDASVNTSFYRWWIRNLAYVDVNAANIIAKDIYSKSQVDPYKHGYRGADQDRAIYAKRNVLRGAAEAKLTGLCETVYADLQPKETLKRDYFSVAQERIHYLSYSCPTEFKKTVSEFNVAFVKAQAKKKTFEPSYAYDYEQKDYRDSIWQGVEKYFPKDQAVKILGEYICDNNEVIQGAHFGSNIIPEKYPIQCLCNRFDKELLTLNQSAALRLTKYLNKCYPEKSEEYWRTQIYGVDPKYMGRTYEGLIYIVKDKENIGSPARIYNGEFRAFFIGTKTLDLKIHRDLVDWSTGITSEKAVPILEQALYSQDAVMIQAALYAFSFYPSKYKANIIDKLKENASQNIYPNYLYAAYTLAVNNDADAKVSTACERATAYHLNLIENRTMGRYAQSLSFNVLLNLDLCSRVGDKEQYLKLMNIIFTQDSMGRYDLFQKDLEKMILSNSINIDMLIERLVKSTLVIDNILGLRLAELKKYQLDYVLLRKMINHDDSYVRLFAANYIKANTTQYRDLYLSLKDNTNKKVRTLRSE